MTSRANWSDVRGRRLPTPGAKAGYERARRAFELADQVRQLREARGLSQAELARRIGSTQPAVARLEAGGWLRRSRHSSASRLLSISSLPSGSPSPLMDRARRLARG